MKKVLASICLFLCAAPAIAGVLAFAVSVDQETEMYFGSDLTNYVLIPADTYKDIRINSASQVVFKQTSSAVTAKPNVRIEYMNATGRLPELSVDGKGVKVQGFRADTVGNYYLTKQLTIPLN